MLAFADRPGERLQNGAVAVADTDVVELNDDVGPTSGFLLVGEGSSTPIGCLWLAAELLFGCGPDDVVSKVGNFAGACHDEIECHALLLQLAQLLRQHGPCLGVQTNERIVEDKCLRTGHQGFHQLHLAQFAAGERDDVLVEQGFHAHQLVELRLKLPALLTVRAG